MDQQPKKPSVRKKSSWNKTLYVLKRNQRQLIGFLLLLAVGGIILYVATKPKEPKTAGTWKSKLVGSPGETSTGTDTDADTESDNPTSGSTTTEPYNSAEKNFEQFMATASNSELIEIVLNLRSQNSASLPINFVNIQRRAKVGRHLLTKDLSESQKRFAIIDYVESVIQLDALNKSGDLDADHVRDHLIEVRDKYSEHPDDAIGAKASLVYILVPIHDYLQNKDESKLKTVADLFDLHAEKIFRHKETTGRFAKLIIDLFSESDFSPAHAELAKRLVRRMEKEEDPEVQTMAKLVREQIYFAKSELGSLVERIEGGNSIARDDVQRLFEGLDANPSSRIEIYAVAANVIAEYDRLGQNEDAEALAKWLTSINKKNEEEKIREAVDKAIASFHELQKDDQSPEGETSADPKQPNSKQSNSKQ